MMFYGMDDMRSRVSTAIAEAAAHSAKDSSRTNTRELRNLETELDRLELTLEAQWSLLQEKLGLTDEDLKRRMREIDLLDGTLDGKVTRNEMTTCPACTRSVSGRNLCCMYCGEKLRA